MAGAQTPGFPGQDPLADRVESGGVFGGAAPPVLTGSEIALDTKDKETKPKPAPVQGGELNLVGSFPNPWAGDPAKEKAQVAADAWFPSTPDFKAVAGASSIEVSSAWAFMLEIMKFGKQIQRLNFFSHGITGLICFKGAIALDGKSVTLDTSDDAKWSQIFGKTKAIVDPYAKDPPDGWGVTGENSGDKITVGNKSFSLDDVRAKFTNDAVIWLYLCHGASDPLLMQQAANTFQVTVKGFDKTLVYCVPANFPIDRKHKLVPQTTTKPADSCPNAVSDFRQLDSHANVRSVTPKKP
jgi:hypothetical protein